MTSLLRYAPSYKMNIDLKDKMVWDANGKNFGKQVFFRLTPGGYWHNAYRNIYLHQLIADACVWNDRPDLYTVVDHINGVRDDNDPNNLRHVNCHINSNSRHHDPETQTPPGLTHDTTVLKSGNFWSSWVYKKNNCALKYFRRKRDGVDFANDFNRRYVARMIEAYDNSPGGGDIEEWRRYWSSRLISNSKFRKTHRADVLNLRKFIVTPEKHLAMCGFI